MISGDTISEIETEIRLIHSTIDEVVSVWGFGSFFRGEPQAKDIDLVAVIEKCDLDIKIIELIRQKFDIIGTRSSRKVDLTILTRSEFDEKPLMEMDALVPLSTGSRGVAVTGGVTMTRATTPKSHTA